MLEISLLGRLGATWEGEPLRLATVGAAHHLWAYLLLARHEPLPRARVAFALWPDAAEAEALANLRRQLHLLLQQLPPAAPERPWVDVSRSDVGWNAASDYRLDVEEFERLCQEAESGLVQGVDFAADRFAQAVSLYAGDLLPDVYEDWVLEARERLRDRYVQVLRQLLGLRAAGGDLPGALAVAERLLSHDDLCEEVHRLVIGLRYVSGDRAAALRAYNDCRRTLEDELGIEPMVETIRIADEIRAAATPQRVLRLLGTDLPAAMSLAVAVPGRVPQNLPVHLTTFIGRGREIEGIVGELAAHRLVTLVGPAGCGKSRLALEVASRVLRRTERAGEVLGGQESEILAPDGAWWVDLSSLEDPALVPAAVANVMGVREARGEALLALLERAVRARAMLLVVDNAEHSVGPCAEVCRRLLYAGPGLRVLATSREVLGVAGERTWTVAGLSVPPDEVDATAEAMARYEAVQLLEDRAGASAPDFRLTDANAPSVAALCRALDGNPLAIELAAARLRDMPVGDIVDRLHDRFTLLSRGSRTGQPYHRTLGSAIDWSYAQLPATERRLLRRLSVFQGGWTLSAAEEVCADDSVPESAVLDLLASLVDGSLVAVKATPGTRRYDMAHTVREYASSRLGDSGEAAAIRTRHVQHFLRLAEASEPHLAGGSSAQWLDQLEQEHGNLRAALEWAAHDPDNVELAGRMAMALWRFWETHGHFAVARHWLERLADATRDRPDRDRHARLVYFAGTAAMWQGDLDGAAARTTESLALFRHLADLQGESWALNDLGLLAALRQEYEHAVSSYEESLAIKRQLGDAQDVARSLVNLGELYWRVGDLDRAEELYREGRTVMRTPGTPPDIQIEAVVDHNLGEVARCRGDLDAAEELYRSALATWRDLGDRLRITLALDGLAGVAAARRDPGRAARLFAASEEQRRELGSPLDPDNEAERLRMMAEACGQIDCDDWEAAMAEGRRMTLGEAVAFALGA